MEEAGWDAEGAPEWKKPECRPASSQSPHLPPIAPETNMACLTLDSSKGFLQTLGTFASASEFRKPRGSVLNLTHFCAPVPLSVPLCLHLPISVYLLHFQNWLGRGPRVSGLVSKTPESPPSWQERGRSYSRDSSVLPRDI